MAGELFEVSIPALRTGAGELATDSGDVKTFTDDGAEAAAMGKTTAGEGSLASALADLEAAIDERGTRLTLAVGLAGTTLSSNADTYDRDDASAAAELAGTFAGY